jgi:hypothetical protein
VKAWRGRRCKACMTRPPWFPGAATGERETCRRPPVGDHAGAGLGAARSSQPLQGAEFPSALPDAQLITGIDLPLRSVPCACRPWRSQLRGQTALRQPAEPVPAIPAPGRQPVLQAPDRHSRKHRVAGSQLHNVLVPAHARSGRGLGPRDGSMGPAGVSR